MEASLLSSPLCWLRKVTADTAILSLEKGTWFVVTLEGENWDCSCPPPDTSSLSDVCLAFVQSNWSQRLCLGVQLLWFEGIPPQVCPGPCSSGGSETKDSSGLPNVTLMSTGAPRPASGGLLREGPFCS